MIGKINVFMISVSPKPIWTFIAIPINTFIASFFGRHLHGNAKDLKYSRQIIFKKKNKIGFRLVLRSDIKL